MNKETQIYKATNGDIVFNFDEEADTLWATEEQVSRLFNVDRSVINRHIRNIYRDGELDEERTAKKNRIVRKEGTRSVTREVNVYNLDAIISIGYRVNSKKATDFRIWATKILHHYVTDGVAINERRLKELDNEKLHEIENALGIVKRLVASSDLSADEASGILEVITKYGPSFKALEEFDEGHISFSKGKKVAKTF